MTANQINYAKLQEDIRHNKMSENETVRHNIEDERIRSDTNAINWSNYYESYRHNVESEAINAEHYGRMDEETARSHLAQEAELSRSNRAQEALKAASLEEDIRHNKKTESETKRHNKAQESVAKEEAKAATSQAATAAKNANTRVKEYKVSKYTAEKSVQYNNATLIVSQQRLEEEARHNKAMEKETKRHNKETETNQWNANQISFITSPTGSSKDEVNKATAAAERAKATESLARAGYLKTQDDWYAWNQAVNTAVDLTQALKNFTGAIPVVGVTTK